MNKVQSTFKINNSYAYAFMSLRFLLCFFLPPAPGDKTSNTGVSVFTFWNVLSPLDCEKNNCKYEPSDLSKDFADHFMTLRNQSVFGEESGCSFCRLFLHMQSENHCSDLVGVNPFIPLFQHPEHHCLLSYSHFRMGKAFNFKCRLVSVGNVPVNSFKVLQQWKLLWRLS